MIRSNCEEADKTASRLAHGPGWNADRRNVEHLRPFLESGDTIIDGGNSFYKDDVRRSDSLKKQGIDYLDAGTSGGVWGLSVATV
jgi:6-phosphogluconate dehydrogenase